MRCPHKLTIQCARRNGSPTRVEPNIRITHSKILAALRGTWAYSHDNIQPLRSSILPTFCRTTTDIRLHYDGRINKNRPAYFTGTQSAATGILGASSLGAHPAVRGLPSRPRQATILGSIARSISRICRK